VVIPPPPAAPAYYRRVHQQRKDPLEGTIVDGRYVVHSRLARGGMSTVYLATDRRLDRRVALKVLYPHLAEEPGFIDRFEQEAKSAARLSHPNVVGVLDQGVDDLDGQSVAYLVMEFVEGSTLRDELRQHGSLTPRHALRLLDAVVEGLAAAHDAGLIHRDVKPENVLLSRTGQVKIADFGLARAVSATTGTATLVGTVAYLSPELVLGRPAEAQSDIYSTGVMLYELLTGQQPFTGDTPIQVAIQHAQSDVPAPSALLPGLATDIDELVRWCTSRDPEERPVDGSALLGELRHIRATLTDEELDLAPARTPPHGGERDQLTAAVVPHLPLREDRTVALPSHDRIPPQGGDEDDGRHRGGTDEGRAGWTEVLPRGPATDNTTNIIGRDGNATRVIGALPAVPPSLAGQPDSTGVDSPTLALSRTERAELSPVEHQHRVSPTTEHDDERFAAGSRTGSTVPPLSKRQQAREAQRPQKSLQSRTARRSVRVLVVLLVLLAGLVAGAAWLFGSGPAGLVSLPDVANVPLAEARAALDRQGLGSLSTEEAFDDDVLAGLVIGTDPGAYSEVRRFERVELIVSKGPELFAVPELLGRTEVEAAAELGAAGFVVGAITEEYSETAPVGEVIGQTPLQGTDSRRNSTVDLVVSLGPAPVPVPDVAGRPEAEAVRLLEAAGLEPSVSGSPEFSRTVPSGSVLRQQPGGVEVQRGTTVTLTLSRGPRIVRVPNVFSLSEDRAVEALEAAGFAVQVDYTFGSAVLGLVAGQSPSGEQPEGTTIRITVT
jgi:beta-lactam-binding protein with PASTA domain/serine/threonine protein kinase